MAHKAKAAREKDAEQAPQRLPDAPEIMQIPTSHGPLGDVNGLVEVYTKDMSRIMLGVSDITQQAAELHGRVADMLGKLEDLESRVHALEPAAEIHGRLDDFGDTAADLYRKIEMLDGRLGALEQQS